MAYWEKYSKHFIDVLRTFYLRSRIFRVKGKLDAEFFASDEPVAYEERLGHTMTKIKPGEIWQKKVYGAAWFRFTGKMPADANGKHYELLIDIGGEGCLYDNNGYPIRGITDKRQYVSGLFAVKGKQEIQCDDLHIGPNGEIDFWLDAGCNNNAGDKVDECTEFPAKFVHALIVERRDDIAGFFYDYSALAMAKACSNDASQNRMISSGLNKAFLFGATCTKNGVGKARNILAEVNKNGTPKNCNAFAVGHSHLDLGFLWPIRETRRKSIRTFANQLKNIEKFPDYVFGLSQPQLLEWLEMDSPALFGEVKNAIMAGNIVPHGGMWVEADMNVTSGESIVRQCFYGRKYWREKFGLASNVCWLPDTFGYNGNLPQIIKKCGMPYFLSTKMSWNDCNKFPYHSFIWEGIDGSRVLAHFPPEETYSGEAMPTSTAFAYDNYTEKEVSKNFLLVYGIGDGGGGPAEGHIEFIKRQKHAPDLPKVTFAPAIKMFNELEKESGELPHYKGELYLEKHQGTYTTRSDSKKCNRQIEIKLHNLEFVLAVAYTKGFKFNQSKLDTIWKEALLYQFHDILPGSASTRVYKEASERYAAMFEEIEKMQNSALEYLEAESQNTEACALNMSPVAQTAFVDLKGERFIAKANAYSVGKLAPYAGTDKHYASDSVIENELFKVVCKSGKITSLFDKKNGKEICGEYLNRLCVYLDPPGKYDAWDLAKEYYKNTPEEFKFTNSTFGNECGTTFIENHYEYGKSHITQKIVLDELKPYVDFVTEVDWHEEGKMLRAEFRPSVYAKEATCDMQFGSIRRSTEENTDIEKAQFEICAHKYIELSSNGYNISMLSNLKYGWRVKNGLISLNLFTDSAIPAKHPDHGKHTLSYAIYPHSENENVVPVAYSYNQPIKAIEHPINIDNFVAVDTENVIIETIKVSDDGKGIVVRAYESKGEAASAKITAGFNFIAACECDCVEENRKNIDINEKVSFGQYEIKTFIFLVK